MRFLATVFLMSAIALATLGEARAQTPKLLNAWTYEDLRPILEARNITVVQLTVTEEGGPLLLLRAPTGLSFSIGGAACEGSINAKRCRGAQLIAIYALPDEASARAAAARQGYAAVQVRQIPSEPTKVAASRYLIFDGGVTSENVAVNLDVFLSIVHDIARDVFGPPGQRTEGPTPRDAQSLPATY